MTPDDASKGGDTIPNNGSRSRVSKTSQYIWATVTPKQINNKESARLQKEVAWPVGKLSAFRGTVEVVMGVVAMALRFLGLFPRCPRSQSALVGIQLVGNVRDLFSGIVGDGLGDCGSTGCK